MKISADASRYEFIVFMEAIREVYNGHTFDEVLLEGSNPSVGSLRERNAANPVELSGNITRAHGADGYST